MQQITALFTDLTWSGGALETTHTRISSLMDTWILLRDIESSGERNRGICVLKSRGMAHSNQIRELLLTDEGVDLVDAYLGPEGVLAGAARHQREAQEKTDVLLRRQELEYRERALERKRRAMEAQLADYVFPIPETIDALTPILTVLPLQLLAYYAAVRRDLDVDRPRHGLSSGQGLRSHGSGNRRCGPDDGHVLKLPDKL